MSSVHPITTDFDIYPKMKVTILLVLCIASAIAKPQYFYEVPAASKQVPRIALPDAEPGMPYDLDWAVSDKETGNDFAHEESSSDGIITKGSYRVLLPDGKLQVVTFTVNGNEGYVADVQYQK